MLLFLRCYCVILLTLLTLASGEFNSFEEHLLFKMSWPGPSPEDLLNEKTDENSIVMTTAENEQYKCTLPTTAPAKTKEEETYSGPSALELIRPLMAKDSCIYKLEQYWAYELCHGSHLRQFHDEKEAGKESSLQEYNLGQYDISIFEKAVEEFALTSKLEGNIPTVKLDGNHFPYVSITMTGGTMCDLSGKARVTRVKYICYPELKHQIYSLEETATCEYDVVVITYLLCKHPDYSLKAPETNEIQCHAVGKTPNRPLVLENLETESFELNPQSIKLEALRKQFEVFEESTTPSSSFKDIPEMTTPDDKKLVQDFLHGDHCLYGKSGWWKYEFCYSKTVMQFHQETDGSKTVISLGTWNKEDHLEWLTKNPHKKPKLISARKHISHYYSNGDFCTETKTDRHVEVRLKCKTSSNHPNAVSMTLLEPSVCEYILVIESPILCSLIPQADENGLIEIANLKE